MFDKLVVSERLTIIRMYSSRKRTSPADLWGILSEPGNGVQYFFLSDFCSQELALQESD